MGQTLSEPITEKTSTHGSNNKYFYGCSHMQGWRLSKFLIFTSLATDGYLQLINFNALAMEDAHTTLLKLGDTDLSFFGVYDGHGGKIVYVLEKEENQRLTLLCKGSSIAHYTGQTLYKKVLESKFFEKKEYAKAMTDAFLTLDKCLIEGNFQMRILDTLFFLYIIY